MSTGVGHHPQQQSHQHPPSYQSNCHPGPGGAGVGGGGGGGRPRHDGPHDDEDLLKPLKLNFTKKLAVGSGHVYNDLVAGMWFSYLLVFLQNVTGLSPAAAGYLMLLGQIADAIATPCIGLEAERAVYFCKNYGRCKSWHILGAVIVTLTFPFVFLVCMGCDNSEDYAKMIYYAPFTAISQIGWASTQISHLAIIPKVSPDELVRTEILAIRYAFTVGANITIFLLAYVILGVNGTLTPEDSYKFTEIAMIATCIGLLATLTFHLTVTEESDVVMKRSVAFLNSLPSVDTRRRSICESIQCSMMSQRTIMSHTSGYRRRPTIGKYSEEARQALLNRSPAAPTSSVTYGCTGGDGAGDAENPTFHLESSQHHGRSYASTLNSTSHHPHNSLLGHLQHSLQVITDSVHNLRPTNPLSTTWLSMGKDKMEVSDWLKMFHFYVVSLIYMATRLSVNVTQVFVPMYLQKSLHLSVGTIATVPLTMYVSGFIVTCCLKSINKYVGRQLSYIFGATLSITGALFIAFYDWEHDPTFKAYGIYFVGALLGGGGSAMLVTSLSISADLIGTNVESGAFVYGAMSFVDKLSCGLVISLINYAAPCQGQTDSCDQSLEVPFYRNSLAGVCGGTSTLGVLLIVIMTVKIYVQNLGKCH